MILRNVDRCQESCETRGYRAATQPRELIVKFCLRERMLRVIPFCVCKFLLMYMHLPDGKKTRDVCMCDKLYLTVKVEEKC